MLSGLPPLLGDHQLCATARHKWARQCTPFSKSAGFVADLGCGAVLIISGNVLAVKYFFPGCSFVPCSREYCSRLLSRYRFRPYSSVYEVKKLPVCFPMSSMNCGGMLNMCVSTANNWMIWMIIPEHFDNPSDLIVFASAGEQRQTQK